MAQSESRNLRIGELGGVMVSPRPEVLGHQEDTDASLRTLGTWGPDGKGLDQRGIPPYFGRSRWRKGEEEGRGERIHGHFFSTFLFTWTHN